MVMALSLSLRLPYGPFKDPIGKPLVWQREHWDDIDPTVFIDDDGQAYMYWGNPNLYCIKLNNDMISYSGEIMKMPHIDDYQEGPWFYKRNGHYYLAFASTCCPEGIGYAMSDSPTGPWTYKSISWIILLAHVAITRELSIIKAKVMFSDKVTIFSGLKLRIIMSGGMWKRQKCTTIPMAQFRKSYIGDTLL